MPAIKHGSEAPYPQARDCMKPQAGHAGGLHPRILDPVSTCQEPGQAVDSTAALGLMGAAGGRSAPETCREPQPGAGPQGHRQGFQQGAEATARREHAGVHTGVNYSELGAHPPLSAASLTNAVIVETGVAGIGRRVGVGTRAGRSTSSSDGDREAGGHGDRGGRGDGGRQEHQQL